MMALPQLSGIGLLNFERSPKFYTFAFTSLTRGLAFSGVQVVAGTQKISRFLVYPNVGINKAFSRDVFFEQLPCY
jgi:hypothetical protein